MMYDDGIIYFNNNIISTYLVRIIKIALHEHVIIFIFVIVVGRRTKTHYTDLLTYIILLSETTIHNFCGCE